jgi:hypothetical protein
MVPIALLTAGPTLLVESAALSVDVLESVEEPPQPASAVATTINPRMPFSALPLPLTISCALMSGCSPITPAFDLHLKVRAC